MNVTLVENTEDQVHDDERSRDQERDGGERLLERLRIALEIRIDRARHADLGFRLCDGLSRLAERRPRSQVEAEGNCGELPLIADRERLNGVCRPPGECGKRDLASRR